MIKYAKERDKALESRNPEVFIEFMEKWAKKGSISPLIVMAFKSRPKEVQIGTMAKMVMQCTKISMETRMWAMDELDKLGWSYEIKM
jgi:hypothetical protein